MKRIKLFCILSLFTLFLQVGSAYGETKVRVGFLGHAGQWFPLWIASDYGLFRHEQLDVEIILLSPARLMYSALYSEDIQFAVGSAGSSVLAQSGGLPLKIIMSFVGELPFEIWSIPSIASLKDLKGRKVAGSPPGGIPDLIIKQALKKAGLMPKEVLRYNLGQDAQRFAALKTGVVEVAVLVPPLTYQARQGGFHRLAKASEIIPGSSAASVTVKRDYLERNPEIALKISWALVKSVEFSRTHPAETVDTIMKWTKQGREQAQATYESIIPLLVSDGQENLEGIRTMISYNMAEGLLKGPRPSPERFVDLEFQKKLLQR